LPPRSTCTTRCALRFVLRWLLRSSANIFRSLGWGLNENLPLSLIPSRNYACFTTMLILPLHHLPSSVEGISSNLVTKWTIVSTFNKSPINCLTVSASPRKMSQSW
jgi:hypothetical protein